MVCVKSFVLLAVCCVTLVASDWSDYDVCQGDIKAWNVFVSCGRFQLWGVPEASLTSKADLEDFLGEYCTNVLPETKTCFAEYVSKCDDAMQARLNALVEQTGFICQPGGTTLQPVIQYVLSHISDDDVSKAYTTGCTTVHRSSCVNKTTQQLAVPITQNNAAMNLFFSTKSTEELETFSNSFAELMTRCYATEYRESADDALCPGWRAQVLLTLGEFVMPTHLGVHMPFTLQDAVTMFQL